MSWRERVEAAQVAFYGFGIVVLILVAIHVTAVLSEISASMKQDRLRHEQLLKDHVQQLKDHERTMARLAGEGR